MTNSQDLIVERRNHVALLTLNRPDQLNALGGDLMPSLVRVWPELDADPDVRVVVMTGAGRAFCSGADVGAFAGQGEERGTSAQGRDPIELYPSPAGNFTARQARVYKPVITAVNGVCAGAGLHFVADADIVLASEKATFVDTHVNVGQVTALEPIGLSRRMPFGLVTRMVCMGRHERIEAARAYEVGMVSEVVPHEELLDRALELAELVATASPTTLQVSLRAIWEGLELGLTDAYHNGFRPLVEHWSHPDAVEGPRAFVEKREPRWAR